MGRALSRTLRRAITREELFSGNRESIRMAFFSRESILWWVVTSHRRRREQYGTLFAGSAFPDLERVVLTRPAEANRFLVERV
jgi:hypothetical protein